MSTVEQVIDKRGVNFEPKQSLKTFTGEGQSVGGETQPSRLIPSILHKSTTSGPVEHSLPGM